MAVHFRLIRRGLALATAIALPASVIALVGATGGVAAARGRGSDPAVTCGMSGSVQFGYPGISKDGSAGLGNQLFFIRSVPVGGVGCSVLSGSGSGALSTIIQRVKCDKHTPGLPASNPACRPGLDGFESWANFLDGSFASAIQRWTSGSYGIEFVINGHIYLGISQSSSTILAGGRCGSSEIGYQTVGKVKAPRWDKSQTMTITECLSSITGSGLNPGDNFYNASVDQVGVVATAQIDPATSTVHIG
jgi:hypothetical protein